MEVSQAPFPLVPTGLDLYKRNQIERIEKNDNDTRRRRTLEQINRTLTHEYFNLDSPTRRNWDAEARRLYPQPYADLKKKVDAMDVYCNEEEIYNYRKGQFKRRRKFDEPEADIRRKLQAQFNTIDDEDLEWLFDLEAKRINTARGLEFKVLAPVHAPNNGPRTMIPDPAYQDADLRPLRANNLQPPWQYHSHIGQGGYGRVMLYRRQDQFDNTIEVVVIKRDRRGASNNLERAILEKIQGHRIQSDHIVKYVAGSPPTSVHSVTILEYYPHGDLHSLFVYYMNDNLHGRFRGPLLPEPFCWYLFHSLAEAAVFLELGTTTPSGEQQPATTTAPGGQQPNTTEPLEEQQPFYWDPMFHYDLKPANILLGAPQRGPNSMWWHRHYPTPVMADFGGVSLYPEEDGGDQIPDRIRGNATRGYRPFEMFTEQQQRASNESRERGPPHLRPAKPPRSRRKSWTGRPNLPMDQPIRIHTTIYQIGLVLWQGMTRAHPNLPQLWRIARQGEEENYYAPWEHDYHPRQPIRDLNDGYETPNWVPETNLRPQFSERLVQLVYRCMHPDVEKRPTTKELFDETKSAMLDIDQEFNRNHWDMAVKPRALIYPPNKYPINLRVLNNYYTNN